jgi:hypothetical protein
MFLLSTVSAGNVPLCRGQHVARELRVDRAASRYRRRLEINYVKGYEKPCLYYLHYTFSPIVLKTELDIAPR